MAAEIRSEQESELGGDDRPCRATVRGLGAYFSPELLRGGRTVHGWDQAHLAALRMAGDQPADAYVASLLQSRSSFDRRSWLVDAVAVLRRVPQAPQPDWVLEWEHTRVPQAPWADPALIAEGQRFFNDWSFDITTALFCAALPFCYASGKGAAVLANVSELYHRGSVGPRIALTGHMLLAITAEGGLNFGADGYITLRRVRLLHSCVRAMLLDQDPPWSTETRGVPINQEDLLGTLIAFTAVTLAGLERLGYSIGTDDQRAYLHLWSVAGHVLGIQQAERIADVAAARNLMEILENSLEVPSAYGAHLMEVLLASIAATTPSLMRTFPAALVRRLAGARLADMLSVPNSWWSGPVAVAAGADRLISGLPTGRWALRLPSRLFGRAAIRRAIARGAASVDPSAYWPDRF
jgi:hypothetical protein